MKKIVALLLGAGFTVMLHAQKSNPAINSLQKQLIGTWTLVSVDNIYLQKQNKALVLLMMA